MHNPNQNGQQRHILVFRSASREFGLDISCVREVLRPKEVYPLPKTPPFVEGVIQLRGRIVALIDLGKKLCSEETGQESNKRIIVCKVSGFIVGLTVTNLSEVLALSPEDFGPTPEPLSTQVESNFLSGLAKVGERIIPILNLEHLLTQREASELATLT